MNKRTLAEQALRILEGGNTDSESELDIREIELAIGQNLSSQVQDYLFQLNKAEKRSGFVVPEDFLKTETVTLTNNKATFSFKFLSLPHSKGVYEVIQDTDCGVSTIYPMKGRISLVNKLDSYDLQNNSGYIITGKNFRIYGAECSEVDVTYVPDPADVDSEEELVIPNFLFNAVIIKTVKDFMPHIEIPEDLKQDNDGK